MLFSFILFCSTDEIKINGVLKVGANSVWVATKKYTVGDLNSATGHIPSSFNISGNICPTELFTHFSSLKLKTVIKDNQLISLPHGVQLPNGMPPRGNTLGITGFKGLRIPSMRNMM